MSGLVVFLGVIVVVVAVTVYLWTHRGSKMARGIGSAAQQYNDFYQVGQAPRIAVSSAKSPNADSADPLRELRADLYRRNRARRSAGQ